MEKLRLNSLKNFITLCIILHSCLANSNGHLASLNNPTSESPHDGIPASESPIPANFIIPSLPLFPSMDSEARSNQADGVCTLDVITATMSDDQILKKTLEAYASRHGLEKMRELIVMTTGLVFVPESLTSSNSVLPTDEQTSSNTDQEHVDSKLEHSSRNDVIRESYTEKLAGRPSNLADIIREAVNSGGLSINSGVSCIMIVDVACILMCSFFLPFPPSFVVGRSER